MAFVSQDLLISSNRVLEQLKKMSLVERGRGNVPVLLVWGWGELVMLRSHDGWR